MYYMIVLALSMDIVLNVLSMDPSTVDLLTPQIELSEACGYQSCPDMLSGVLNVHIVPHTHAELGYTDTFDGHYTGRDEFFMPSQINMKRILDFTISELWVHQHRRFTFSDTAYLFHWWSNRDETVRRMVYQLIRQGRLNFVGGGWSMTEEATTSYHAIIDHFTYSLRKLNATFLSCGRPLVAWQADVLGHSREFTSLMAQMGFDGLFINPISYDDEMERLRRKGLEFIWRGSDDLGRESDIYTHKLFDGYWSPPGFCFGGLCSDPLLISSSQTFNNLAERVEEFTKAAKFRQGPYYVTNNIMVMMGQRYGYYDASVWFANIDKLITVLNSKENSINAIYSTPACYLKAVYESNPKLQTKQDDFLPYGYDKNSYATGMYSSRPSIKYMAREGHRYLQIAKQLQVIARLGNNDKIFEEYSWINGVFQDHNILSGESRDYVVSYYIARMTRARNLVIDKVIQNGFNKLRKNPYNTDMILCRFNVSRCACTDGPHMFIVVYNPLAWPVTMPIRLPMFDRNQVVYDPQGKKIPAGLIKIPEPVWMLRERNSRASFELTFIAENLPPMGLRSYYLGRYEIGWERPKRGLTKKITNIKKYLVRQTNNSEEAPVMTYPEQDYEYFDDVTTKKIVNDNETKIVYDNISERDDNDNDNKVITLKSNVADVTTTDYTTTETTARVVMESKVQTNNEESVKPIQYNKGKLLNEAMANTEPSDAVTRTPSTEDVEFDYWERYKCHKVGHNYIRNRYVRVNIDKSRTLVNVSLANGIKLNFNIQMFYYIADDPSKAEGLKGQRKSPGAYLFRTMDDVAETIKDNFETIVYKNNIVQEIHCRFSSWASIALRLYKDNPVLELDWLVGPVPVDDGLGKEVMIKYITNINNNGVFYTDSNGRQTMKRIRNARPMFEPSNKDPIAGNLYPVTSKIYIEDLEKNVRFAVFNDRSQAGSSFKDGELTLLLHRRLVTEDSGIQAILNETDNGNGVVIRGLHYIYISQANHKPHKMFEKKLAKEIELKPQILVSPPWGYGMKTKQTWLTQNNEYTAIKTKLPLGVHVLTLQEWNEDTILLRLENYLEKSDLVQTGIKKVLLKDLFTFIRVTDVKETTLSGHMWLNDWVPLTWNRDKFMKSYNDAYGSGNYEFTEDNPRVLEEVSVDIPIELYPQQIRTLVLWYEYVE